jgi:hypothetical protein
MSSFTDTNTVRPELLLSALIGDVRQDDYFAIVTNFLDTFVMEGPSSSNLTEADTFDVDQMDGMVEPGHMPLEHGYVRRKDGTLFIAVFTDLGYDVNGEMFDWWIRNCDNDEKFRWWHTKSNKTCTWDPQFFAVMPHERKRGHVIDHTQIMEIELLNTSYSIHIEYSRPSKYFDVTKFIENGITACLVGRMYISDAWFGMMAVGYVLHMVREIDGRSELRSRFWFGEIAYPETVENFFYARMINSLSQWSWFRAMKFTNSFADAWWLKCSQEMNSLKQFLPHYYSTSQRKKEELIRSMKVAVKR